MDKKVAIIILNWNGWKDTIECLESVYQIDYPNYNVIVVDNNSEDESLNKIRKYCDGDINVESTFLDYNLKNKPIKVFEYENLEVSGKKKLQKDENVQRYKNSEFKSLFLIKNTENHGFAEGNNIGIRFALNTLNSDYIFILNNDTVVEKHFLSELVKTAESSDNIGIVGPSVYYYNLNNVISYIGSNINLLTGSMTHPHLDEVDTGLLTVEKMDCICGCSLLIKKIVIEDIGLLDPDFFLYYEDTDWCLRAKNKGYNLFYTPKAKIWHKLSRSFSLTAKYYGTRNQPLLIKKNANSWTFTIFFIQFLLRKFLLILFFFFTGRRNESYIIIEAVNDFINGNYGFKSLK